MFERAVGVALIGDKWVVGIFGARMVQNKSNHPGNRQSWVFVCGWHFYPQHSPLDLQFITRLGLRWLALLVRVNHATFPG